MTDEELMVAILAEEDMFPIPEPNEEWDVPQIEIGPEPVW